MKKLVPASAIACTLLLFLTTFVFANTPIKLTLNGEDLETDVAPQMVEGRVLVPIRTISEALGVDVEWKANENTVAIQEDIKPNDLRISLLEQALAPKDPLSAATGWAEGVKTRNGAMQYAFMSPELKKEKYEELSQNNWSTGVSSPWVDSYEIAEKAAGDAYQYEITFTYTDSTKSTLKERQIVYLKKVDSYWFVDQVQNIDIMGTITEVFTSGEEITGVFVENPQAEKGSYDKARVEIMPDTKIFDGYSGTELSPADLKKGSTVEVTFNGPVPMIYPVQGGAKTIRVIESN